MTRLKFQMMLNSCYLPLVEKTVGDIHILQITGYLTYTRNILKSYHIRFQIRMLLKIMGSSNWSFGVRKGTIWHGSEIMTYMSLSMKKNSH
jgi:hypothetical protein